MLFTSLFGIIGFFVVFGLVALLTETERYVWATLSIIASLVAAHYLADLHLLAFIKAHTLTSVGYLVGFIVVGVVWSFIKWFSFLVRVREVMKERGDFNFPVEYRGLPLDKKPLASENKKRITAWMIFWPFSLVGTLLNDPIRRIFNLIFNSLKNQYQRLSDRVFRDVTFPQKKD